MAGPEVRGFKAGAFRRDNMPTSLRRFSPSEALDKLEDIDLDALKLSGKSVILLDVDNTLLPWRSHEIPPATRQWLDRAREMGFRFCILSNTRNPSRLDAITKELGIDYVRDKFKPSTRMYNMALERLQVKASEAVMVGDQLLTDILGANRAGIDAIWIRPMGSHEFVGTRYFSRNVERVIGSFLHRYFHVEDGPLLEAAKKPGFFDHHLVRQFVKFCLVGASSTLIDAGLHFLLMFVVSINGVPLGTVLGDWALFKFPSLFSWAADPSAAAVPILKVPTACLAILNAYYWNRKWTFEQKGSLRRYYVVALLGMVLNTFLTTVFNHLVPGHPKRSWAIATAIATIVVAFWNFTGSRIYVFRDKQGVNDRVV